MWRVLPSGVGPGDTPGCTCGHHVVTSETHLHRPKERGDGRRTLGTPDPDIEKKEVWKGGNRLTDLVVLSTSSYPDNSLE